MNEETTRSSQNQGSEPEKTEEQIPKVELPAKMTPSTPRETLEYRGRTIRLEDLKAKEGEQPAEDVKELMSLYERTVMDFKEGEIVQGKIIAIGSKEIAVDIGFKSEGSVRSEEFDNLSELKIGDDIEVLIHKTVQTSSKTRKCQLQRKYDSTKQPKVPTTVLSI